MCSRLLGVESHQIHTSGWDVYTNRRLRLFELSRAEITKDLSFRSWKYANDVYTELHHTIKSFTADVWGSLEEAEVRVVLLSRDIHPRFVHFWRLGKLHNMLFPPFWLPRCWLSLKEYNVVHHNTSRTSCNSAAPKRETLLCFLHRWPWWRKPAGVSKSETRQHGFSCGAVRQRTAQWTTTCQQHLSPLSPSPPFLSSAIPSAFDACG